MKATKSARSFRAQLFRKTSRMNLIMFSLGIAGASP
jgi:hypothetical protein